MTPVVVDDSSFGIKKVVAEVDREQLQAEDETDQLRERP